MPKPNLFRHKLIYFVFLFKYKFRVAVIVKIVLDFLFFFNFFGILLKMHLISLKIINKFLKFCFLNNIKKFWTSPYSSLFLITCAHCMCPGAHQLWHEFKFDLQTKIK